MAIFAGIYYIALLVAGVVIFLQFGFMLLTGKLNEQLLVLGQSLSIYLSQILLYLTYSTEEKPFPFQAWPVPEESIYNVDLLQKKPLYRREDDT